MKFHYRFVMNDTIKIVTRKPSFYFLIKKQKIREEGYMENTLP